MSRRIVSIATGVAACVFLSATALTAQTAGTTSKPKTDTSKSAMAASTTLASSDASFLKKAAEGGLQEVELGKLATERASDPDVKKFGQRMVDNHSKANDELAKLAQQKGVTVPSAVDAKGQREIDKLSKLSGADFDKAYMKEMVSDHKKDVAEFEKASKSAKDSDVKSFASGKLPTLREHLDMAKTDSSKVHGGKIASANPPKTSY